MMPAEVRACLETHGWPVDVLSEATMQTRFRSHSRVLRLLIHFEESYLVFAIVPFARLAKGDKGNERLVIRLLELNREMNMAKFSVDPDGDVVLSVEYPLANLDPSEVRDAVDVLTFYAENHGPEIEALATASRV
jgi:hypothetical protein